LDRFFHRIGSRCLSFPTDEESQDAFEPSFRPAAMFPVLPDGVPTEDGEWSNCTVIPVAGNAFISQHGVEISRPKEQISNEGLTQWCDKNVTCSLFFHLKNPSSASTIQIALRLRVPQGGSSRLEAKLNCICKSIDVFGEEYQMVHVGSFGLENIPEEGAYYQFTLRGICKTGPEFAKVTHLYILACDEEGTCPEIFCVTDDFYFGRRGPSIHLKYEMPKAGNFDYFYNEVFVPEGQDVHGAYFSAIAFHGGYLGMQVNSLHPVERRMLFSIWSAFETDNPDHIPEEYKVVLVEKGEDVYVGEFGNEGSGAQSYLKYNWTSGKTYGFLLHARPLSIDSTVFSAWFREDKNSWRFLATFHKPKEATYVEDVYSFSENFLPDTGHVERKVCFKNQWARDADTQEWKEITKAQFTGDETSKKDRKDFAAGVENNQFYLRNCGFFSDGVPTGAEFERCACINGTPPNVDVLNLPRYK